jgi:hypothetical protein
MLEIEEIIRSADQGRTHLNFMQRIRWTCLLCQRLCSDSFRIDEGVLGADLAQVFGLPVPLFDVVSLERTLVAGYGDKAVSELKGGHVFASKHE